MLLNRNIALALLAGMLVLTSPAQLCAAPEPLVITRLADPDPNYVPPAYLSSGKERAGHDAEADAKIDEAMQNFGRVLGQAAIVEQQQILALCRSGTSASASLQQRFAYEASCRYSRH